MYIPDQPGIYWVYIPPPVRPADQAPRCNAIVEVSGRAPFRRIRLLPWGEWAGMDGLLRDAEIARDATWGPKIEPPVIDHVPALSASASGGS
jgi:hypothetical protein